MLWMTHMNNHGHATKWSNSWGYDPKETPKDPNKKRVLYNTIASAGISGIINKVWTTGYNRTNLYKGFFGSFVALQSLQSLAQKQTTPLPIGLFATGATAALGFALKDHAGSGVLLGGRMLVAKMRNNPAVYGNFLKGMEGVLSKVTKIHPLFKNLATPEGIKFAALLTTLPVAHSLIRRAALKISKSGLEGENPMGASALHSEAGHTKRHHEHTGTSYEKNLKQQATVAVTGGIISHINTGHLLGSFR